MNLFTYWTYRFFAPGAVLRQTYDAFQRLLAFDSRSHELMAEFESLYYQGKKEDFARIALRYDALAESVEGMVRSLGEMAPGSFVTLAAYFRKFDFYCRFLMAPPALSFGPPFVLLLTEETIPPEIAGSKTTNLVELARFLDLTIPSGFVITTNSFSYLIEYNDLRSDINVLLSEIDLQAVDSLQQISAKLVALIRAADVPQDIENGIHIALARLMKEQRGGQLLAVRSSALSEDGHCSFAGQYTSCLNVKAEGLLTAYLEVLSSKYSPEALAYRIHCGLSDEETPMAVMVLEMVEARSAGVIYTADPAGVEEEKLFVHAARGLGDSVVSGTLIPDVFTVEKSRNRLLHCSTSSRESKDQSLTESQLLNLSEKGLAIERYFARAQDIEWAMEDDGFFVFLQSRPLKVYRPKERSASPSMKSPVEPLFCGGVMAASGVGSGKAWCLDSEHSLEKMTPGSVLVIRETLPGYVSVLHQVNAVVAELGSAAGHFATVCREFGVPLLLGVGQDINCLEHGKVVTVSADGLAVYPGENIALEKTVPAYEREKDLPFYRKLRSVLDFITPLKLVDPHAKEFTPESCRSFHDIIRFAHEMAVQTMFSIGGRQGSRGGRKKQLQTSLPFEVYLVDVDGGLEKSAAGLDSLTVDQVCSTPFQALWKGLSHSDISWGDQVYYDWKGYDRLAMSDAFAFQSSADSASYAVLGKDYLNMNIRFGYHFTVVDALCEPELATSYCTMRFAGGGGAFDGRELRILFLTKVLTRLGFAVECKGDLLDARISGISSQVLLERIESLGKLLGVTKQMDMRLQDVDMVEQLVESYFQMM
ncbi:MAG: hypothetical protein KJ804_00150 [Proteobacteria bacterium]|nr:hypothetical protein [Pseudomonadota bacterium]MBU1056717.1 hypothetical protein [Pseudomonadota bacterium]